MATTNAANEITSTTNLATPTYDRTGNMVSTPKPASPTSSWDVTYDAWNRVVEVTDGMTTVTYEYDGTRRRIERNDGTVEHIYYDGEQVIETRVPDGQGGFETDKQYVWSLRYVDSPILRDSCTAGVLQTGDRLYYLTDANQNVTAVTNNAGVVQERYDYDAYGKVTIYDANWANPATTSAVGNTLLFAGQDVDADTGLQYARARWYSSSIGGFISRDPIGFSAEDLNLYRYAGNNSVIYVDPSGLYTVWGRAGIAGSSGAVSGAITGGTVGFFVAGPPGIAAGAAAGGVAGGIAGMITGALMSPKASLGELAFAGAVQGGIAGAFAGYSAARVVAARAASSGESGIGARLASGAADDVNGLTRAGHALEKHGSRLTTVFPKATGNVAAKNAQGQKVLQDLLSSNNQLIQPNRFRGQDIFDLNTFRGARFDSINNLIGFLQP